jgi:hypothetical protein
MRFGRNSRKFSAWMLSPLMPALMIRGVHFEGEDDPENPTGAPGGGTATANPPANPPPAANPASDPRVSEALKERKKAKAGFRALVRAMGGDPEKVKIVATGDPAEPYRIEGIDNLDTRMAAARAVGASGSGKRGGTPSVEVAQITAQRDAYKRQVAALIGFIKRTAVVEPIRANCVKHGAIDDDNGAFDDIVGILAPKSKVDIDFDPEDASKEPEIRVYFIGADGQPIINQATGQLANADFMVADFLAKRPKYRQANFRSGPGAGNRMFNNNGNGNGNGNITSEPVQTVPDRRNDNRTPDERVANEVAKMFNMKPEDLMR